MAHRNDKKAAVELLARKGPDGLTINAVARRSGVARASIYLRYPGREALLAATVRAAIGREPFPLTGELTTDLRLVASQAQAILANPAFRGVLPEIVRGLLRQPDGTDAIDFDTVAPNRHPIADEYRGLAENAGLRTDIDPDLPPGSSSEACWCICSRRASRRRPRWRPRRPRSSSMA